MAVTTGKIRSNLDRIREDISTCCAKVGRSESEVRIVAVTKSVDFDTIKNALDAGLTELGESRPQQLATRAEQLEAHLRRRRNELPAPVRWHQVGHVQRNKVKLILGVAELIHSLDSLRLAEEIERRAERADTVADVLLEVNCSQEQQKHGCAVGAATHLAELACSLKHLRLRGLMTMAPLSDDPEQARPSFVRLRELFEEIRHAGIGGEDFRDLSMGMSQDYRVAVEEGATMVRIGSALFE